MFLFRKKYHTGLDIGTSSIKVFQLRDDRENTFDFSVRNITFSDREDPTLNQIQELMTEIIDENKKITESVSIALQDISIFIRYIEIPKISTKELRVALPIEAKKYIPFPIEEESLQYNVVPPLTKDPKKMGITFVAVPQGMMTRYDAFLQNFNIKSRNIEANAFASARAFKFSELYRRGETVSLVNIGTKFTNVTICRDGNVYFSRDILMGGRDITKRLVNSETGDYKKAEVVKRTTNLFQKEPGMLQIRPVIDDLTKEIEDCHDFFTNFLVDTTQTINYVVLSGGGALLKGFPAYLKRRFKIDVDVDNKLEGKPEQKETEEQLPRFAPTLKLAYGLALRDREESS